MNLTRGDAENDGESAKMAGTSSVGVSESQGAHQRVKVSEADQSRARSRTQ